MYRLNESCTNIRKRILFLLGRMYFSDDDVHQVFLVFALMLSSLILDNNKKVTYWILIWVSSENIKPLDTNLEPTMSSFTNGRIIWKFNSSAILQTKF